MLKKVRIRARSRLLLKRFQIWKRWLVVYRWQVAKGFMTLGVTLSVFMGLTMIVEDALLAGLVSFITGIFSIGRIFEYEGSGGGP